MSEFEWIRMAFLNAGERGEAMSREALRETYLADLAQAGSVERIEVSELWIDVYWKQIAGADIERLMHKARHPDQFWKALGPLHHL